MQFLSNIKLIEREKSGPMAALPVMQANSGN